MNWFKVSVRKWILGHQHVGWYVGDLDGNVIHPDGTINKLLINDIGSFDAIFHKEEQAKLILDKYKVPFTVKDLKPGDTFKFVMKEEDIPGSTSKGEVCTVYSLFSLPVPIHIQLAYTIKSQPYDMKWINVEYKDMEVNILSRIGE